MTGRYSSAFKLMLAAVFVWIQAYSLAHAAEHGHEPHDHDGVECELTVFASEDIAILPAPPEIKHFFSLWERFASLSYANDSWQWPLQRGPPARGPPSTKQ